MNKTLVGVLSFGLGAAVGALISWHISKKTYMAVADEAIADVKARYSELYGEEEPVVESTDETTEQPLTYKEQKEKDVKEYAAFLAKTPYVNYSDGEELPEENKPKKQKEPETKPNTFITEPTDLDDGYEITTLNYYSDNVLATLHDNDVIDDYYTLLGDVDLADYFADGTEDVVYVRNADTHIEYEILYDPRKFSEVIKKPSGSK